MPSIEPASPNTIVLLGAGASVDAGLPDTVELNERLCADLPPLYRNLSNMLATNGSAVDPERVFRLLAFLHAVETRKRPADRRGVVESPDVRHVVKEWTDDVSEFFAISSTTRRGSPTGQVIDELWDALREHLSLRFTDPSRSPDLAYVRDLLSAMKGQPVVTLNYDNVLQHVRSFAAASGLGLDDAPYPKDWSKPTMNPQRVDTVRLIHLHGSLDWRRSASTGEIVYIDPNSMSRDRASYRSWFPDTPGIIFGAGNKLRPDGPYLELYMEFRKHLADARQVVVIGYGFRDEHVNEALRRWYVNAESTSILRIGSVEDDFPTVVDDWGDRSDLLVQYIQGRAKDTMRTLIAPRPRLTS